jgi:hypothetical protein
VAQTDRSLTTELFRRERRIAPKPREGDDRCHSHEVSDRIL